jgi:hypothetical protein
MEKADLKNRFDYHAPDGGKAEKHEKVRAGALRLANLVNSSAPDCREKSLAVTAIEEAMMWANAAIARHPEE